MKKYIFILIVLTFITACKNSVLEDQSKDEYEIISLLYEDLAKRMRIPPPPPSFLEKLSFQDSLEVMERHKINRDSLLSLTHIVAVDSIMGPVELSFRYENYSEEQTKLLKRLKSLKDYRKINIERIENPRDDSIIKLEEHHIDEMVSDYFYFDQLISFSRIAFNKKNTHAAVVVTVGTSGLASGTGVAFLQKKEGKWTVVYWDSLLIS